MTKALVLTNHLMEWAGSEVLTIEVSELLSERYQVTVCGNQISSGLQGWAKELNIQLVDEPSKIDLFDYNFIWSQHCLAPLCKNFENLAKYQGIFNSVHLSPYEPLELASLMYANVGVNSILANSEETEKAIHGILGRNTEIINFYNAAPPSFFNQNIILEQSQKQKDVLIVSNHIPSEMLEAINILQNKGLRVTVFGLGAPNYRRLTPEDLKQFDSVVSIGKTVQYSILGRKPVYCYDRFGGPGWINMANCEKALRHNFSGRCCNTKKNAAEIASEIIFGFNKASLDVNSLFNSLYQKFDLAALLEKLENNNKKVFIKTSRNPYKFSSEVIRRLSLAHRAAATRAQVLYRASR